MARASEMQRPEQLQAGAGAWEAAAKAASARVVVKEAHWEGCWAEPRAAAVQAAAARVVATGAHQEGCWAAKRSAAVQAAVARAVVKEAHRGI